MAPTTTQQLLLSPAELSYIHSSLSLDPPIRPDLRTPTQFRPLIAESDILPTTNGSARICFADGTEAIVGVKAEVEKSAWKPSTEHGVHLGPGGGDEGDDEQQDDEGGAGGAEGKRKKQGVGENSWIEISVEIPGYRDDDTMPIFLSAMLIEAVLASGDLKDRLWLNNRFHWKLYIDILLLSAPSSYPLPLLSLTTHLALLSTRLPRLISDADENPLFDDDWHASTYLYPRSDATSGPQQQRDRPAITLLVMSVGENIVFDPSREELAVAECVVAISVGEAAAEAGDVEKRLRLLAIRTIDPPSRLTPPGVPDAMNSATGGEAPTGSREALALREGVEQRGVWRPPRGGVRRGVLGRMIKMAVERGGVGEEVLEALERVES
ncbi:MAG: hypothetical protein M1820_002383 [Bogoriella megaspora]|nr:MAG: hypothetical protein M1820_002383 [Bogoriella megaspora]